MLSKAIDNDCEHDFQPTGEPTVNLFKPWADPMKAIHQCVKCGLRELR